VFVCCSPSAPSHWSRPKRDYVCFAAVVLSVVKAMVSSHGGEVSVGAAPGDGAVFTVRQPGALGRPIRKARAVALRRRGNTASVVSSCAGRAIHS
jgi:hypothetical protein